MTKESYDILYNEVDKYFTDVIKDELVLGVDTTGIYAFTTDDDYVSAQQRVVEIAANVRLSVGEGLLYNVKMII